MNGKFQFSLKQSFLVITLLAACLGVGKWCYLEYVNRIHPVTRNWELQSCLGKRVSLCGRFQYLGNSSAFQVVWFGEGQTPIAIAGIRADGSPLPKIPDGAPIVVEGRLTNPPNSATFPIPIMRRDWRSGYLVYDGRNVETTGSTCYFITAEEIRQTSD